MELLNELLNLNFIQFRALNPFSQAKLVKDSPFTTLEIITNLCSVDSKQF